MTEFAVFWPAGTVYGCLLNFRAELEQLGEQVDLPPYKGAPKAPVLYVKTANTWSANGAAIAVDAQYLQIEVGASIAMVMGPLPAPGDVSVDLDRVAGFVLVNDLSLPHTSFFRPPVRFKCQDGFLGVGSSLLPASVAVDPAAFRLEVRINGQLCQSMSFAELVRDAARLLHDVGAFMTLQQGDLLLLGCAPGRPMARVGDRIDICSPNWPGLGTLSNVLRSSGEAA